jgi:Flp pilus assembly pilin Flp
VNIIFRFVKDQAIATAIDEGLIALGISLSIIAAVNGLGPRLNERVSLINSC